MLADAIVASGWTAAAAEHRNEACYGSLALIYPSVAAAGTVAPLVHPDDLGALANTYPLHRPYIDAFADHVRDALHLIRPRRTRTYPRSLRYVVHAQYELLHHHTTAFHSWNEPFFQL